MIYFDNAATTPIDPAVREAMLPFLHLQFGNPSSKYYSIAEKAKIAVNEARSRIAELLGCEPEEVIFTSGSTESNNMILKGLSDEYWGSGKQIITSKAEHSSILETADYLQSKGLIVIKVEVDSFGKVNLNDLEELLHSHKNNLLLISLIWGNNELGSINNIHAISTLCNNYSVAFHTDATQVTGKLPINLSSMPIDFLSLSSHKIYGPKGIGAAVIKKNSLGIRTHITPLIHGGGQEFGYRSGTLNVPAIVGFGKAAEIAKRDMEMNIRHLETLDEYFSNKIKDKFDDILQFNSPLSGKLPGILNIRFKGVHNELLIKKIAEDIAISSGSACSSSKPSHVLQSIGCSLDEIRSSLRISFSKFNTLEEIDQFIGLLSGDHT
ncbi:cysteine desulfurase family protein [Paenibacillus sp. sgz500958]|uniref:cysteine desulfurase family protein n=1 Tax=Paenibacillus sp. sgz500958 TaxID=3242475 RepID=UPI0036D31456